MLTRPCAWYRHSRCVASERVRGEQKLNVTLFAPPQFTDEHGEVCPVGWRPGKKTMVPAPVGSQAYFQSGETLKKRPEAPGAGAGAGAGANKKARTK